MIRQLAVQKISENELRIPFPRIFQKSKTGHRFRRENQHDVCLSPSLKNEHHEIISHLFFVSK